MKVKYSSNNSGGSWWLSDEDWRALEAAGWQVEWGRKYFCRSRYSSLAGDRPAYLVKECEAADKCPGHPTYRSWEEAKDGKRWLGALATNATCEAESPREAIEEWERATGKDASAEGCNCCGAPHSFSWGEGESWGYASGEEVVRVLYERVPTSFREPARILSEER